MTHAKSDIANPVLYRLYWGFMLPDICRNLGLPPTTYVKERLHEIHKKALNYESIAGKPQQTVSLFLFEIGALWACFGVFVRTKEEQPIGIEWRAFTDLVLMPDGKTKKRVWDLL
jgi:hypothetical protein